MNDMPPEQMNEILDCIYSGRKIEAIKLYPERRGTGLKEAKQFIEQLTSELREASPEKFRGSSTIGCASLVLWVSVLLAAALS